MYPPKLYVFDIDGTLLNTNHEILVSTREGLALLIERNYQIMLASARPPGAIEPINAELGLKPFYISLNGALVIHKRSILLDQTIDKVTTQEVIARALRRQLSVNVYCTWNWFIPEVNLASTREGEIVGFHGQVREMSTVEQAHKILIIGPTREILSLQQELLSFVPQVLASQSNPTYLEVVAADVSKAEALKAVCGLVGMSLDEVAVFGDGENDLPMLEIAGIGVAMGNAHPRLKKVAHFTTASNDEAGILWGIRKILLGVEK